MMMMMTAYHHRGHGAIFPSLGSTYLWNHIGQNRQTSIGRHCGCDGAFSVISSSFPPGTRDPRPGSRKPTPFFLHLAFSFRTFLISVSFHSSLVSRLYFHAYLSLFCVCLFWMKIIFHIFPTVCMGWGCAKIIYYFVFYKKFMWRQRRHYMRSIEVSAALSPDSKRSIEGNKDTVSNLGKYWWKIEEPLV